MECRAVLRKSQTANSQREQIMAQAGVPPPDHSPTALATQLSKQRRTVDFDTFDIHMQQLISMLKEGQIKVSPKYQRQFRWQNARCSQFIESLMLGIPIPSLFMATNADSTWEVVDGVQRLSTIIKFAGDDELRKSHGLNGRLVLSDLQKLSDYVDLGFNELPANLQLHFWTRPVKVVTLNDKSDSVVRYDLFERLNTGGVALSAQEIRDCVFQGDFADKVEEWSKTRWFRRAVKLTPLQQRDATGEECVLRFFAFRNKYKKFEHSVTEFLNTYMQESSKVFDYVSAEAVFMKTFKELARVFPEGISRGKGRKTTPLNFFEGVSVGASLALDRIPKLHTAGLDQWLDSEELREYTTGATNDKSAVRGRIEFCRDRFLGKPYVPRPTA
jgi:hypothetical protein